LVVSGPEADFFFFALIIVDGTNKRRKPAIQDSGSTSATLIETKKALTTLSFSPRWVKHPSILQQLLAAGLKVETRIQGAEDGHSNSVGRKGQQTVQWAKRATVAKDPWHFKKKNGAERS